MDPISSGAIFKVKDLSLLRSPVPRHVLGRMDRTQPSSSSSSFSRPALSRPVAVSASPYVLNSFKNAPDIPGSTAISKSVRTIIPTPTESPVLAPRVVADFVSETKPFNNSRPKEERSPNVEATPVCVVPTDRTRHDSSPESRIVESKSQVLKALSSPGSGLAFRTKKKENATAQTVISIHNWSLKRIKVNFVNSDKSVSLVPWIALTGKGDDGQIITSLPITRRIDKRIIESEKGVRYNLVGELNLAAMEQERFPQEFISEFKDGFGFDWKVAIRDVFRKLGQKPKTSLVTASEKSSETLGSLQRSDARDTASPKSTLPSDDVSQAARWKTIEDNLSTAVSTLTKQTAQAIREMPSPVKAALLSPSEESANSARPANVVISNKREGPLVPASKSAAVESSRADIKSDAEKKVLQKAARSPSKPSSSSTHRAEERSPIKATESTPSASPVAVSRSGRCVVKPVEYWRNQYKRVDARGNFVEITAGSPDRLIKGEPRSRFKRSSVKSGSDSESESASEVHARPSPKKAAKERLEMKAAASKSPKKSRVHLSSSDDEDDEASSPKRKTNPSGNWTPEEIVTLNEAIRRVDPSVGKQAYWDEVAKSVPGKSAEDCRNFHYSTRQSGILDDLKKPDSR